MASITAVASASSYSSANVSNLSNAYANTTNTTYGNWNAVFPASSWLMYSGFDFSSLPANATVSSVVYKVKLGSNGDTGSYGVRAYISDSAKTSTLTYLASAGVAVYTLTVTSAATAAQLKSSAANNYFFFTSDNSDYYLRVYGMEITVNYTVSDGNALFFGMNF